MTTIQGRRVDVNLTQKVKVQVIVWYLARIAIRPISHKYALVTGPVRS